MECPKCKGREIYFTKVNRIVNMCGKSKTLKRYTCLKCNHKFDFY